MIRILILFILIGTACSKKQDNSFSFVFMTDVHITPKNQAEDGFRKAIDSINALHPAFVISGGDQVKDALDQPWEIADSLYNMYLRNINRISSPIYNTLGNHDVFGLYQQKKIGTDHPDFGKNMYERKLGPRYYSFTYKNWKFFILDAIQLTLDNYFGYIDSTQRQWITEEIKKTDTATYIALVSHIPFLSLSHLNRNNLPLDSTIMVLNNNEILTLFTGYQVRLVLQGHLHYYENNVENNIYYITGGSISGAWWKGVKNNTEEGFCFLTVNNSDIHCRYVDYQWEAKK